MVGSAGPDLLVYAAPVIEATLALVCYRAGARRVPYIPRTPVRGNLCVWAISSLSSTLKALQSDRGENLAIGVKRFQRLVEPSSAPRLRCATRGLGNTTASR